MMRELGELCGDGYGLEGGSGGSEEGVGREARAGAVGLPLVLEEAGVRVDFAELGRVGGAWCVGAVLGKRAAGVLGPEAVEDEGGVVAAFGGRAMGVAEFGGPGEVEEVEIEALRAGGLWKGGFGGSGLGYRRGSGRRVLSCGRRCGLAACDR